MQESEKFNAEGNAGGSTTRSVNVFLPGQTYTVFLLFAKETTRQVYEIYLGTDATAAAIKPARVSLNTANFKTDEPKGVQAWLTPKVMSKGIVSVTIDLTKLPTGSLAPSSENGMCQPHQFCAPSGKECRSTLPATDPRKADYDVVCGEWAVKDLDCPRTGCYGFTFTIPDTGFNPKATVEQPTPYRPQPTAFPTDDKDKVQGKPNWLVKFLRTTVEPDSTAGGQCNYAKLPGTDCAVPDWVPQPPK
jgi:hypothetical protein